MCQQCEQTLCNALSQVKVSLLQAWLRKWLPHFKNAKIVYTGPRFVQSSATSIEKKEKEKRTPK